MLKAFLLSIPFLFLTACLSQLAPRSAEKKASLQSHIKSWTGSDAVLNYGRSRSHQVFDTNKLTIEQNVWHYKGGMGMLSVISNDGYALTAAHVLKENEENGILTSSSETKRVHICVLKLTINGEETVKRMTFLQAYPQKELGLEGVNSKTITSGDFRIVHRFPRRDLVLVKIPLEGKNFFSLGERPARGDLLFSSGNSQASQPGPSSGVIKKITSHDLIHATLPLAPGDSGGPIMNASGALVGIAVQGRLGDFNTFHLLNHSGIELVPKKEVMELIEKDRTRSLKK